MCKAINSHFCLGGYKNIYQYHTIRSFNSREEKKEENNRTSILPFSHNVFHTITVKFHKLKHNLSSVNVSGSDQSEYLSCSPKFMAGKPYSSLKESGSVFTNHSQEHSQGLYSPTILKNILCLFSARFCIFECNTTSDWLNHMFYCVTFKCC